MTGNSRNTGRLASVVQEVGRTMLCSPHSLRRQSKALLALDDHLLKDIGLDGSRLYEGNDMHETEGRPSRPNTPQIRTATTNDIERIQAIYARHVLEGIASFEETPPNTETMAERMLSTTRNGLPYLAAEVEGRIVGYSYATPYHHRPAYRHTIEDSVYVDPDMVGRGIGRALLTRLIEDCRRGPWQQMVAVIGDSGNQASIGIHARLGFRNVGTLQAVGFKFGRWIDTVIMQRALLCDTTQK